MDAHLLTLLDSPVAAGDFSDEDQMTGVAKVVTTAEAARVLGLSESTLAKLRLNGNGPVYCKLGRRVVYRPTDLEQWLQSRTTRDTSDADARFLKALTVAHPR
jgi:predicted DNA-binding transcriptional regulator AlpA